MAEPPDDAVHPLSIAEWRAWLETHHARTRGVWLVSFKKRTGKPCIAYNDAVAQALCFGWVDSKPNRLDDERTMLWFAPRQPRTGWSRPNKERVERMLGAGLMAAAGIAKVEQAKADGSWSKLDAVEQLVIPDDLATALGRYPNAAANFGAFPRSTKRGILEWIVNAKTEPTRRRRIDETARLAALNERANQWPPRGR